MKRSILFSVAFCMLSFMTVHAQSIPVNTKYGKVSREEVEMTSYQLDTSAVALVLYEDLNMIIDFNATGGFSLVRKKHMRIKILKEEGLDWAGITDSTVGPKAVGIWGILVDKRKTLPLWRLSGQHFCGGIPL